MSPFESIQWPQGRLGIAYSAGRDSTALLALAKEVYPENHLIALHIDHQARSTESCQQERAHAEQTCLNLKVPLYRRQLDPNLKSEAAWREARYRELAELGHQHKLDWIATAHHALDQCETILLNLLRGTGLNGLKGMPSTWTRYQQNFCRPLLNIEPEKLYDYLEHINLKPFLDPSNSENQFKRNQLRNNILPMLEEFQPGALKRIVQTGSSIEKTWLWQQEELKKIETQLLPEERSDYELAFDRTLLKNLPEALLDIWCHQQLCQFADGASKISRQHIENLTDFICSNELGYLNHVFPGEIQVRAQKKKIIFKRLQSSETSS
jgi:tRNA(Ile)-lysidine synthase